MIPPIADRFVAGESPATALEHVRQLNERNVKAIVNLLGEHYDERDAVAADAAEYRRLVDDIAGSGLEACVSVKPSQLGLDIGEAVFREELAAVVDAAAERGSSSGSTWRITRRPTRRWTPSRRSLASGVVEWGFACKRTSDGRGRT